MVEAKAKPDKRKPAEVAQVCGGCKFFNERFAVNGKRSGSCTIKLPPKYKLADRLGNYLIEEGDYCDLWKPL
jgi:hypothetical protein